MCVVFFFFARGRQNSRGQWLFGVDGYVFGLNLLRASRLWASLPFTLCLFVSSARVFIYASPLIFKSIYIYLFAYDSIWIRNTRLSLCLNWCVGNSKDMVFWLIYLHEYAAAVRFVWLLADCRWMDEKERDGGIWHKKNGGGEEEGTRASVNEFVCCVYICISECLIAHVITWFICWESEWKRNV